MGRPKGSKGKRLSPEFRFWKLVDQSGGPSACWRWLGTHQRYGRFTYEPGRRKVHLAHRVAYALANGVHPDQPMHVLHKCDNTMCCNPAHLELGTHTENMRQCVQRNRRSYRRGGAHPWARLTDDQVASILSDTRPHRAIAPDYGVCPATISHIKSGRNWRHLGQPRRLRGSSNVVVRP